MGRAHLIIDLIGRYDLTAETIVVHGPEDYAAARTHLYACIERPAASDVTVVVRHAALRAWFDDLRASPWVHYEEYSPLRELAQILHLDPPHDLTDQDVVALQLDRLAQTHPPDGSDMQAWILEQRLGNVWLERAPPRVEHLAIVIQSLLEAPLDNQWILQRVRERLGSWSKPDMSTADQLWRYLAAAPAQRARALASYAAVHRYPREQVKRWLSPALWKDLDVLDLLPQVGDLLHAVAPLVAESRQLEREVRTFLKEKVESGADIHHLLGYTSGKLSSEASVLILALIDRPQDLTQSLFDRLSTVTAPEDRAQLEQLRHRLPVAMPEPIPDDWAADRVEDVFSWVEQLYLPWYRSVRYRGDRVDADPICLSFVKWLQRAYPTLIAQAQDTILGIRDRVEEMVSAGRSVIWIIIDGLGLEWADTLAKMCVNHGMVVTSHDLSLTMLPTITHVAKPALIGGIPPAMRPMNARWTSVAEYRAILERGRWREGSVRVAAEWGSETLADLISSGDAAVWLYLVNQIDKSVTHDTMPYKERVRRISVLCDSIVSMVHSAQDEAHTRYGQRPAVVFSSDHGYTTPTQGAVYSRIGEGVAEGRCVALADDEVAPAGWWVLDPPEAYGLTVRYALAYGHHFPQNTSDQAAMHGGANPEEAVVSYIACDGIAPQIEPPDIQSSGTLPSRVSHQDLMLTASNPNPLPLEGIELTLDHVDTPIMIGRLARKATVTLPVVINGAPLISGDVTLRGTMQYVLPNGMRCQKDIAISVAREKPLQGMTAEQEAFEDMFND